MHFRLARKAQVHRAPDGGPWPPAASLRELFRVLDLGRRPPAASFLRTADPRVLFASRDAIGRELALIGHEWALMITQAVRELFRAPDGGRRSPAAYFLRTADPSVLFASRDAIGHELALIGHELALMIAQAVREFFRALDGGLDPRQLLFYVLRIPVYSSYHETPSDTSWHSSDMRGHS